MGGDEIMENIMSGVGSLINAIATQINESQKFDATIKDAKASIIEKINALEYQYQNLLQAKNTLYQAIQIAQEEAFKSQDSSKIDYNKVAIYFAIGLIGSVIIKKFIKK